MPVADENGVRRVDDNHIAEADSSDQPILGLHVHVSTVGEHDLSARRVSSGIALEFLGHGLP
jgi:hypothetical protein